MPRSSRRNPLTLMVLATLWEEPTHPYQIVQTLKARRKDRAARLNYGSLYTVVAALERDGLIESTGVTRAGNLPPRTTYQVTAAGKEELLDWMTQLLVEPQDEFPAYLAALSELPILPPDEALALLDERSARLRARMADFAQQTAASKSQLPDLFVIERDYLTALMQAELDFTGRLATSIRHGTLDGLPLWRAIHGTTMPDHQDSQAVAAALVDEGIDLDVVDDVLRREEAGESVAVADVTTPGAEQWPPAPAVEEGALRWVAPWDADGTAGGPVAGTPAP